jgi:group II intron reverse transcriptase/maturase
MGDTPRSPTISTQSRASAQQGTCDGGVAGNGSLSALIGESSLVRVRMAAEADPQLVFTSLAHRIDVFLLKQSFVRLSKSSACGIDQITAKQYAEHLMDNLHDLHQRLRSGRYRAMPVKRVWIEKENGQKRPIGIPALEDKIVQRAVATLLETVYDAKFHAFSHGFRRGHSQHKAIAELREQCRLLNVNWIVSADITGLFDNIDHGLLRSIIQKRVNDGGLLRLIGKWLHAGVMEGEETKYPERGTPQGGVISPVLSNIFLHEVLDEWYVGEVKPRMRGRSFLIRWADDFIMGFESESDMRRVKEVLAKRFLRFKLELHPEKTACIPFGRPRNDAECRARGTFDFLGFTIYWGKSRQGYWVIKKKTAGKRKSRFMKGLWRWCKAHRHEAVVEQQIVLSAKLRGFYQYFGVRGNFKALAAVYRHAQRAWLRWLNRRSSKGKVGYEDLRSTLALPKPRIVHNI